MSLKAFHIFFILVSILFSLGFSAWEFRAFAEDGDGLDILFGIVGAGAGIGLVVYLMKFVRKLKGVRAA